MPNAAPTTLSHTPLVHLIVISAWRGEHLDDVTIVDDFSHMHTSEGGLDEAVLRHAAWRSHARYQLVCVFKFTNGQQLRHIAHVEHMSTQQVGHCVVSYTSTLHQH